MKNKIIALSFLLVSVLTANAQQERVSRQLYTSAYKIATDGKEDVNVRKAASFKVDAITYLNTVHYQLSLIQQSSYLTEKLLISILNLIPWLITCMSMLISLQRNMHVLTNKRGKSKSSKYSVMRVSTTLSIMIQTRTLYWYISTVRTILLSSHLTPTGLLHLQK